jgi:lysophospholipase L1-like esterase
MSILILLSVALCLISAIPSPAEAAATPDVVIIGDSLTVGARPDLERSLASAGIYAVLDAAVSRHTAAGYAEPFSGVRALRRVRDGNQPKLVVAALGTNDITPSSTRASARRDVAAIVSEAGSARVCWVELHRRGADAAALAFERANGWFREAVEEAGGCWLSWTPSPDEWAGDGVHLTGAGYARRAAQLSAQIVEAVSAAASPASAPPPIAASRLRYPPGRVPSWWDSR